ncbi:MAG TPA: YebC/PmpR family DNA-binding transcriptional regulator [Phycisphaerales bacterium]|nr:YebC/PmpR family DNA-binding transcriptional regulator [Phycisphaerales bacterium]
MAGHSKWANIRHRKERQDKKRSKVWSKCSKAIMVAARAGGPDPDTNLSLRYAIDEAKYANMPKDTIKRAIQKGAGAGEGDSYESITYEGYGPAGTAIIIETLTDNKNRTVTDIRTIFKKCGGSLGNSGAVAYLFQTKGQILVDASKIDEDTIMEHAINAGAEDVQSPEATDDDAGFWTVLTEPTDFQQVKTALEEAGIEIAEAQIAKIPIDPVTVTGEDAQKVITIIEAIEDNDDVQCVFTNAEIEDPA